ncbi:PTS system, beta-glucoside-specific IIA component [Enterococcus sp. DIV2402]|uniref:PTS system, beta-glucoside-specific IIA component n=1 Tax=Candidatus Enterococcus lowellii TaxID=2230877 RepID=A0ABZ2SMK4_9ENTE|nr:beta-glucoside-specific PTS transporter subunit IIABC [Enterococcus sp. DIV2402]MBO0464318.1 PTS glucose transporter subunit IIA [Enterococcus sp. DIV2402]
MTNEELAKKIVEKIGGEENIQNFTHCATRLRFNLKDNSKADLKTIANLDGVLNAQLQNGQTQVIIGAKVQKIYHEVQKIVKIDEDAAHFEPAEKKGKISSVIETIAGIFSPAIPMIIAGGMLKAVVSLLTTYNLINAESSEVAILSMIGDLVFYFLPFILALSAAKKFKTNEFLALGLAAGYMYPTILNGALAIADTGVDTISFFGLPILLVNYKSTVIPIILSVWFLSYVDKWVNKFMPDFLKIIFSAMIVLLIMIPLQLVVLGPIGSYVGEYLAIFIRWFYTVGGVFSAFALGGTRSLLTMLGMHYAIGPLQIQEIAATGGSYILVSALTANMSQAGAALGVFLRAKDKSVKSLAATSSISAFLGITEPAMFGVNLRYKRPFGFALLSSAIGAAFLSLFNAQGTAYVPPSLLTLPVFTANNFGALIIGVLISAGLACVLTYLFGLPKEVTTARVEPTDDSVMISSKVKENFVIESPLSGEVISLAEVNDEVFSQELVGKGNAIIPTEGKIVAPFDGTISVFFDSKHALGLLSDEGVEILIHVGIDTVNLEGKYFSSTLKQGDTFKKGDVLLTFDIDKIKASGYEISTPIVVTNMDAYQEIISSEHKLIKTGESLIKVQTK